MAKKNGGIFYILSLFLLIFFTWIALLMLYSYKRWWITEEEKILTTKYIDPILKKMKMNTWNINKTIK